MTGGSLAATNVVLGEMDGTGAFTQTGGTSSIASELRISDNHYPGTATYDLQGGSLTAGTVNLNAGGTFTQTGGTLNATTFNLPGGTVTGALENRGLFTYTGGIFRGGC